MATKTPAKKSKKKEKVEKVENPQETPKTTKVEKSKDRFGVNEGNVISSNSDDEKDLKTPKIYPVVVVSEQKEDDFHQGEELIIELPRPPKDSQKEAKEDFKKTISEGVKEGVKEGLKESEDSKKKKPGKSMFFPLDAYVAYNDKQEVVLSFIPDRLSPKDRGTIGDICLKNGHSLEKTTTLTASVSFEQAVRPRELFDE